MQDSNSLKIRVFDQNLFCAPSSGSVSVVLELCLCTVCSEVIKLKHGFGGGSQSGWFQHPSWQ